MLGGRSMLLGFLSHPSTDSAGMARRRQQESTAGPAYEAVCQNRAFGPRVCRRRPHAAYYVLAPFTGRPAGQWPPGYIRSLAVAEATHSALE